MIESSGRVGTMATTSVMPDSLFWCLESCARAKIYSRQPASPPARPPAVVSLSSVAGAGVVIVVVIVIAVFVVSQDCRWVVRGGCTKRKR